MINIREDIILYSERLPWPTSWAEVFGRSAPLLMEIGFGGGHFLVDLAKHRQECNILGVEISAPSLRRGEGKIKSAGLTNARLVQANAQMALQVLCKPAILDEVYINFPDPWPKASHKNRRLINNDFLHLAATRMGQGSLLEIATDHADYAAAISECLQQTPYFENMQSTNYVNEDNERLRTKYEKIALDEDRLCYYYKWRRNREPAKDIFPYPEEQPMPHVMIRTQQDLVEIGRKFKNQHVSSDDTHIKYLGLYQSTNDQQLLVETYVNEPAIKQRVGLVIRRRESGEILIGLHEIGFPRPTMGIQQAIGHLAEWVLNLHPDNELVKSNLKTAVKKTS